MPTVHEIKADFISLAEKYAGKWVALHPETGEVLVVGSSAMEVASLVTECAVEDPLIMMVVEDYGMYVSCCLV